MALLDRTFAAVLFDNDGTLVSSLGSVQRSWVAWAREYDVDLTGLDGMHGVPAAGIIARLAPHVDADAALARISELEVADTDDVEALPGAREAVAAISPAGQPAQHAVATSAHRELAAVRLEAAGIEVPAAFVTIEDVERGKPHPAPFVLAAQRLGVDPADCLVCEDAPTGIAAARAAGCAVLAVTTTSDADELTDADLVVDSLAQVRFVREGDRVRVTAA